MSSCVNLNTTRVQHLRSKQFSFVCNLNSARSEFTSSCSFLARLHVTGLWLTLLGVAPSCVTGSLVEMSAFGMSSSLMLLANRSNDSVILGMNFRLRVKGGRNQFWGQRKEATAFFLNCQNKYIYTSNKFYKLLKQYICTKQIIWTNRTNYKWETNVVGENKYLKDNKKYVTKMNHIALNQSNEKIFTKRE
jgi:hypothetical protein